MLKKKMELKCVQTQMNIILKKKNIYIISIFDRASREGPDGPDDPPLVV